jgi:hypothetical protein
MIVISPLLFMCVFSVLILINIYELKKQISPFMIEVVYNHHIIQEKRQMDNQIYKMLFIQCILFIPINILLFINEDFLIIYLIIHCITFYFFILSSQLFRREVIRFIKKIIRIRGETC